MKQKSAALAIRKRMEQQRTARTARHVRALALRGTRDPKPAGNKLARMAFEHRIGTGQSSFLEMDHSQAFKNRAKAKDPWRPYAQR